MQSAAGGSASSTLVGKAIQGAVPAFVLRYLGIRLSSYLLQAIVVVDQPEIIPAMIQAVQAGQASRPSAIGERDIVYASNYMTM